MKTNILFVCLGNICRSPLAEIIFSDYVKKLNLENSFYVDSAGTADYHTGNKAHHLSIKIAQNHSHDLNFHRARQVESYDFELFDWIIAMDRSNLRDLKCYKKNEGKLLLMRDFDPTPDSLDVPDPYTMPENGFENVYQILYRSIDNFYKEILSKN